MSTHQRSQARIDLRRSHQRFHAQISWLDSHHSFSFSNHYDPDNTHHGLLLVNNEDVVKPETGFRTHPHQDMEIVTWVLDGELEHKDSEGLTGILYPGLAQRMSAGTGIQHSEMNPQKDRDVHFIQIVGPTRYATHQAGLRAIGYQPGVGAWRADSHCLWAWP